MSVLQLTLCFHVANMNTVVRLPERSEVDVNDTWDLGSLFPNDDAWEKALEEFEKQSAVYEQYLSLIHI